MKKPKQNNGHGITFEARRYLIIQDIAAGMKYSEILHKCMEEWGVGQKTAEMYFTEATDYLRSDRTKENLIAMNTERLDDIYNKSMEGGDFKSAIKAIDTQNKLVGGYEEKVKIETEGEINLNFDIGE
jgi:hypothetical protein